MPSFVTAKTASIQNKDLFTAKEIWGQPQLWSDVITLFRSSSTGIKAFLHTAYTQVNTIILTGAGTSAFIGLSLEGVFFRNTGISTRAVATTDLVSHPQNYFDVNSTPLIISFARSGNSPESCAALELADAFSKQCFHLIITCDENGALAQYEAGNPTCVFVLPEAANDESLAMTGSYSSMLLTGLFAAYSAQAEQAETQAQLAIGAANHILSSHSALLEEISGRDFKRAVFLGSGALFGTAKESALKLQELTDGQIICKEDTYLGLRHGPKAVIDEETLVVYFFSSNGYAKQYEHDLVKAVKNGNNAMYSLGISETYEAVDGLDAQVIFGDNTVSINEDFLPLCAVIAGQLLGYFKSLQMGLSPDNPSTSGAITRVVQGVIIYPFYHGKKADAETGNGISSH